jgi:hypothetical protein
MQLNLGVVNRTLGVKHYTQRRNKVCHPTPHHRENLKRSEVSSRLLVATCDGSKCGAPLVRNRKDLALRSAILTQFVIFHIFCR